MSWQQLELFDTAAGNKISAAAGYLSVEAEGKTYKLSDNDIDHLERTLGPCENDDGVSLWWLLRQLKRDGAKQVKLI